MGWVYLKKGPDGFTVFSRYIFQLRAGAAMSTEKRGGIPRRSVVEIAVRAEAQELAS